MEIYPKPPGIIPPSTGGTRLTQQAPLPLGDTLVFFASDDMTRQISPTDTVGLHVVVANATGKTRVWGENVVAVKDAAGASSFVVGSEISISNNTTEATQALTNGCVMGFFASYIYSQNNGSAAFASGGASAKWLSGVWVDGIDPTNGTGIVLDDNVSGNLGMKIGIDLSQVSSFVTGAALLIGNHHYIKFKDTGGGNRALATLDNGNNWIIGSATGTAGTFTTLRSADPGGGILFQSSDGVRSLGVIGDGGNVGIGTTNPTSLLHLSSGASPAVRLDGVGNSTTTATAGTTALPAQAAGFLVVNLNGTNVKVPYYNN